MSARVHCSQCGNEFAATEAYPWGYSHCSNHRPIDSTLTAAKSVGGQEAILEAARLLRMHGMHEASDLIISNVAQITEAA